MGRSDLWIANWKKFGVVRRKVGSINKFNSRDEVEAECARRGYHIIQHGEQWLIFCDKASVQVIR